LLILRSEETKDLAMTILKDVEFRIPRDKVLLRLKYSKKRTRSTSQVDTLIDDMIDMGYACVESRASIKHCILKPGKSSQVHFENTKFTIKSYSVRKHLFGCFKVSFFLCTIGDVLGKKIKMLVKEHELTKALILDAVASEAVEALAQRINGMIHEEAYFEGSLITPRFSPGYGDWEIKEQKTLLSILGAEKLNVSISKTYLMQPEKSITACIGWKKLKEKPVRKILDEAQ
jgi:hypothetical protein